MQDNIIDIEEFRKIKLVVAEIKEASKVENTDKLLRLKIDIGTEERVLVAGVAQNYKPEELVGRKIIVVANLKPAKIRGVESQGMMLAAEDNGTISILSLDKPVKNGSIIK